MNTHEWILVNVNELKIYPLHGDTTLGDHNECDVKLWRTDIDKSHVKFFLRNSEIMLYLSQKSTKIMVNNKLADTYTMLKENDYVTFDSYRFKIMKKTISKNKIEEYEIKKSIIKSIETETRLTPKAIPALGKLVQPNKIPISANLSHPEVMSRMRQLGNGFTNGLLTVDTAPLPIFSYNTDARMKKLLAYNKRMREKN